MRVATGGISHETSSFASTPTTIRDFQEGFGIYRGEEILRRFRDANICTGGFLASAERHGFELVPLLWAFAYPSGIIRGEDYAELKRELLDGLRACRSSGPLDGVLLDLHGAMVVEGIDDGDGDLIASVRDVVGQDCPIIATTDLHANHTPLRVEKADAIIGFDTYPHVDMAERGREAGDLIWEAMHQRVRPYASLRQLPLFWSTPCQVTAHPPMDEVLRQVHDLERQPGVLSVSVSTGFPWADVPDVGASVIAVTDNDPQLAERIVTQLADWIWDRRRLWYHPPTSLDDALRIGDSVARYPLILADHADNTGGGAAGDSTEVLRTFLQRGLSDAVVLYIVDPEVAVQAAEAGVGQHISVDVGGKSHPIQGPPVRMNAEIVAVSDGRFTYDGPMYAGLTGNMGASAWLRQDGVSVVVVTSREQPLGPAFADTLGIDCRRMKYVCVKSAAHFRSGFEKLAGQIINVDAAGVHTHELERLTYRKRTRKVFPIELAVGDAPEYPAPRTDDG